MISILIPTYNYNVLPLVKALHKELEQVEINFEIKIYEDGSTEEEVENKKSEDFKNTFYQKLDQNIGRTAIRSLMALEARFEWLLFLDADVLPAEDNFLKNYISTIKKKNADVIVGGVIYDKEKPEDRYMLRWKYGHSRETKSVEVRGKDPFTIVSSNLCITKSKFLKANTEFENYYGLDNFFSNKLKNLQARVLHIHNPVIHLGLEENTLFLKKALKAVETTVILEGKGLMDNNMRPLQKSYLKLKNFHLLNIFSFVISKFKTVMERNLNSRNPNLLWFDLYRLNYFIQLKKKHNA